MARQWKKTRESDLANHAFSLTSAHYSTLIFHTLGRPDRLLSGVRTSFFFKKPPPELWKPRLLRGHIYIRHLYTPVPHQWANSASVRGLENNACSPSSSSLPVVSCLDCRPARMHIGERLRIVPASQESSVPSSSTNQ